LSHFEKSVLTHQNLIFMILRDHFFDIFWKKVTILWHTLPFSKKSDFDNFLKNDDFDPPEI